ncbi:MAG TPA: CoA transferase [Dehalococcoidia bacterium]|nr:CoA transferase [Dehalococcoidia bacterium]
MADLALSDVRVLDLGSDIPGPYCARLLADFGADVIKVEPLEGDPSRRTGPFPGDLPHPEKSGLFLYLNANKRGITLDYSTRSGRMLLDKLVAWADVLIENNLPSRARALGLDWERLRGVNPKLVLTSITPFGQTGPYADYSSEEIALFAMSGRMYIHGQPDREPLRYAPDTLWFQTGATAAVATMGALFASRRFGIGQHVDISGLEALAGNVDTRTLFYTMGGTVPKPVEATISPTAGVVPCADGYMLMIAAGERFFRRLLRAIGMTELLSDPRFATLAARMEHRDELEALLLPWFAERTRAQAFAELQRFSVMCAPIQTVNEVFNDPQVQERAFFVEHAHPAAGQVTLPGAPFQMQETPWSLRRPAPLLGQHNAEVYGELLGYGNDDLRVLSGTGVI